MKVTKIKVGKVGTKSVARKSEGRQACHSRKQNRKEAAES